MSATPSIRRRRFVPAYGMAALVVTAAATVMIGAGRDEEPEREIAGGYEVAAGAACTGERFDLKQSGRFVSLQNGSGSLGGSLELEGGRLTGDVDCVDGGSEHLDAAVRGPRIRGRLGDAAFSAGLSGDLPVASAQRRRTPGSIDGHYGLEPHSRCLGDELVIEGASDDLHLESAERELGRGRYSDGVLRGAVRCLEGGTRALRGTAVERTLEIAVAGERVTAEKEREEEGLFAAFFIAVGVSMLAARAVGTVVVKIGQPRVMGEALAGIALGPDAARRAGARRGRGDLSGGHRPLPRAGGAAWPDLLHVPDRP